MFKLKTNEWLNLDHVMLIRINVNRTQDTIDGKMKAVTYYDVEFVLSNGTTIRWERFNSMEDAEYEVNRIIDEEFYSDSDNGDYEK